MRWMTAANGVAVALMAATPALAQRAAAAPEVLTDDVQASWPGLQRVMPQGERGLVYPGETVEFTGAGQIDRNHVHRESDETVFLFVKKHKVVDYPQFVQHADHPLQIALIAPDGTTKIVGPTRISGGILSWTVPGDATLPASVFAFVPDIPVHVDRDKSYGAYRLTMSVKSAGRLALVQAAFAAKRMTADDMRNPNLLNRRLLATSANALSDAVLVNYRAFHTGPGADNGAAEQVLKFATDLAPANTAALQLLGDLYMETGRWAEGERIYVSAVRLLTVAAQQSNSSAAWISLAEAQAKLASVAYGKFAGLDAADLNTAEFYYGESASSYMKAGATRDAAAQLRQQAHILWADIRTDTAYDKARKILDSAATLAPAQFTGDFTAANANSRYAVIASDNAHIIQVPLGGGSPRDAASRMTSPVLVAQDPFTQRLLLSATGVSQWWDPRKPDAIEPGPDAMPEFVRALTSNGVVLGQTKSDTYLIPKGEAPIRIGAAATGLSDAGAAALSRQGWSALQVPGDDLSKIFINVYRPDGTLQRRFESGHMTGLDGIFKPATGNASPPPAPPLPDEAAPPAAATPPPVTHDDPIPDLSQFSAEVTQQAAVNDDGDVLALLGNFTHPRLTHWLLHRADGSEVGITPPPPPNIPAGIGGRADTDRSSWLEGSEYQFPSDAPDSPPLYWWAVGQDRRGEWSQGSFSPDGKKIILSNAVAGLLILDAKSLKTLQVIGVPSLDQGKAADRMPLGHRWVGPDKLMMLTAELRGLKIIKAWLSVADIRAGRLQEKALSDDERDVVIALGDSHGVQGAAISWSDGPSMLNILAQEIRLVDLPTRAVVATAPLASRYGFRGIVLDDGTVVAQAGDRTTIYSDRMAHNVSYTLAGTPVALGGQKWYSASLTEISIFDKEKVQAKVSFDPGMELTWYRGADIILAAKDDSTKLQWFDVRQRKAVSWMASDRWASVADFWADGTIGRALFCEGSVHDLEAAAGKGIRMETTTGVTSDIIAAEPLLPKANHAEMGLKSVSARDGARRLVLVSQSDVDEGIFSNKTVGTRYRLFELDKAGTAVAVQVPGTIDGGAFGADDELKTIVASIDGKLVAFDRASGRILSRIDEGGEVELVGERSIIMSRYQTATIWSRIEP